MDFQRMATSVQTSKWEKPILGVLLNLIHHICDVLIRIWLYVQLFVKKLLISSSFKNDFAALEKSLQQSEKSAKHIALAFLESSISIKEVAKLVLWSIASGAKNISLYDVGGYLKHHQNELKDQVKTYLKLAGQDPHLSWNKISDKDVTICLLSREDGQEDIVKAARKLAQSVANGDLRVDELNENLLESNLSAKSKGLADPDILFRFGLAHSNQGFPPWQVRLSEIHDINTHHGVTRGDFYQMATAALEGYVNRLVSVITADGRNFVGTLKGFDQVINLILEDTHERIFSPNAGVEQVVLGLHIVRGDNIAVIGDIDEEIDKRWDLSRVRAEPIISIVH